MNFTKAAEDLSLTQSGISRQIGNLESRLGVTLFERVGSRLVLTDAGRDYAREVQQLLDRLEEVSIDAVRGRKASQALTIGTQPTLGARWLMPRLKGFATAHPDIPLELVAINAGSDVSDLPVDLALLRGRGAWINARSLELFAEELVAVAAPDLLERIDTTGPLNFQTMPTLQNARRPSLWLTWLRATGQEPAGFIQGMRLPYADLVIQAACEGLGIGLVPLHYVQAELETGRLCQCFGGPVASGESYWVVISDHRQAHPYVAEMRNWLMRHR